MYEHVCIKWVSIIDFEVRLYVAYKQNSISSYVSILQLTIAPEKND